MPYESPVARAIRELLQRNPANLAILSLIKLALNPRLTVSTPERLDVSARSSRSEPKPRVHKLILSARWPKSWS
jgi:hypothetical protein